ncbi:glutathione S-transferase [Bacterioplanes sanyensis]|uniref:Glutathione S-transferase n=1 Tax=Bacterioplanes sanyensis TaxID=1249553 RepID=A0A222FGK4_9GAMM|nr:glutathione S-transferase family protein [Bacterioplanes sanyensis]ASP37614.1 glutathione S-transferase [Bacterioplanes sanyensis]
MADIRLYQYPISPFCEKVRRALCAKQLDYDIDNVSLWQTLTGRVKSLSRIGKLPVLTINGQVIADSTNIIEELDQRFPTIPLLPDAPEDRAMVHFFEDWADESLYFIEVYLRFGLKANAPQWAQLITADDHPLLAPLFRLLAPGMVAKTAYVQGTGRKSWPLIEHDLRRHCQSLASWLSGKRWLVAYQLTLADIAVASQLSAIIATPEGKAIVEPFPEIIAWLERVNEVTLPPANAGA